MPLGPESCETGSRLFSWDGARYRDCAQERGGLTPRTARRWCVARAVVACGNLTGRRGDLLRREPEGATRDAQALAVIDDDPPSSSRHKQGVRSALPAQQEAQEG